MIKIITYIKNLFINYKISKVKLNTVFDCEGNFYTITIPDTSSSNSNLNNDRSIFEIIKL